MSEKGRRRQKVHGPADETAPWPAPEDLRRERQKARELRQTQWWKRKIVRGVCHYCQRTFSPRDLTMDHLVPLARGGKSTKGNCVPCCKACNTKKRSLLPMEWDEYLRSLRKEEL
ncbi:MAG: HNH endonuclease [Anaerolineae bacterium]